MNKDTDWWRGAVIYQIYPRSFKDSNNDGLGDLTGITNKLDYIADLGVDAIWICPFYKSPMKDFGYDISNYYEVDTLFGTLDDFKRLMDKAKKLDIKVITDQVINHTSDQHCWFQQSELRQEGKDDWFIWADPASDGTMPNNWLSKFGGPAWTYNMRRGQYYMHTFLPSMPDLNLHNPEVQEALLDNVRFWLNLGVDGLRFDSVLFYGHDPELQDNPCVPKDDRRPVEGRKFIEPYVMQRHDYNFDRPEGLELVGRIRKLVDQYPNAFMIGEVSGTNSITEALNLSAKYTEDDKYFHTVYNFSLLGDDLSPKNIGKSIRLAAEQNNDCWQSWAFSNHDVSRVLSRWYKQQASRDPRLAKVLLTFLCSIRGTPFIYQGEELGLPDANIPYEMLQDPLAIYLWPEWKCGRDASRTPMPWSPDDAEEELDHRQYHWLPIPAEHLEMSVACQLEQPKSILNFIRDFLKWRKNKDVLIKGDMNFQQHEGEGLLVFTRTLGDTKWLCVFNIFNMARTIKTPEKTKECKGNSLYDANGQTGSISANGEELTLPPYGIFFAEIE